MEQLGNREATLDAIEEGLEALLRELRELAEEL